jgi:DNA-binding transcriptional LysR family regulator
VELRQLAYFTRLAHVLNFHRAAADLGISQPALSVQLKKLETELGVTLVDRDNRRVQLTDVGRAFVEQMEPLLAEIRTITADLTELSALSGRVVVGAGVLGSLRLPEVVNAFTDRYPNVDLVLWQQPTDETLRLLSAGELDVGLVLLDSSRKVPREIVLEHKSQVPVGILMRPNHRLAACQAVVLGDLGHEHLILSSSASSAPRVAIDLALRRSGLVPDFTPSETMTSSIPALVSQGLGIGVTTRATVDSSRHKLVFRKLDDVPECTIALAWPRDRPRSTAVDTFLAYLRAWPWDPS